jgi:hypothetical protein
MHNVDKKNRLYYIGRTTLVIIRCKSTTYTLKVIVGKLYRSDNFRYKGFFFSYLHRSEFTVLTFRQNKGFLHLRTGTGTFLL